ncbi:MAG: polyprenyl synthetase family protein [Puniceicoccaceae bacterium]
MIESRENLQRLQEAYEEHHAACIGQFSARLACSSVLGPMLERFDLYLRRPGKRIRPLLLLASHQSILGRSSSLTEILPAAFAMEAFHCFILIHDDVIDESASRRGRASLHADLAGRLGHSRRRGENLAVILGDLLYGYALEKLNEVSISAELKTKGIRYFSKVIQDTGLGEALELSLAEMEPAKVTEAEIEKVYELKTTRYTFEAPLVLGAIMGGADDLMLEPLMRYSKPVGRAFQIANDLHEIRLILNGTADLAYDLAGEIRTLYLRRLAEQLPPGDREALNAIPDGSSRGLERVIGAIRSATGRSVFEGLCEEVSNGMREGREIIEEAISEGRLPIGFRLIAELVERRFEHSEAGRIAEPLKV